MSSVGQRALRELDQAAAIAGSKALCDANRAVHEKLRYGVHIRPPGQEDV